MYSCTHPRPFETNFKKGFMLILILHLPPLIFFLSLDTIVKLMEIIEEKN